MHTPVILFELGFKIEIDMALKAVFLVVFAFALVIGPIGYHIKILLIQYQRKPVTRNKLIRLTVAPIIPWALLFLYLTVKTEGKSLSVIGDLSLKAPIDDIIGLLMTFLGMLVGFIAVWFWGRE